jgi:hypothetical protein
MAMGILNIPLDEDDDPEKWALTDEICASCGERLLFTDEIYLIQIVQTQVVEGRVEIYPVQDEEGDFAYTPHFIHLECWEDVDESTREKVRDEPPIPCEGAAVECSICASGILPWEYLGVIALGELRVSDRHPNGKSAIRFVANGHPEALCIACLTHILIEEIELWDGISQNGECEECALDRCWRTRACECACHAD